MKPSLFLKGFFPAEAARATGHPALFDPRDLLPRKAVVLDKLGRTRTNTAGGLRPSVINLAAAYVVLSESERHKLQKFESRKKYLNF